jgi:hypothetical protein
MEEILINGYLTQNKLFDILLKIFREENLIGSELPAIPGTRSRFDMAFKKDGKIYIVEMDGNYHYQNSLSIKADRIKDVWALSQEGYVIIRIPYWVQLNTQTFVHYFGFEPGYEIKTNFPHGFIRTRILPASFCDMGIKRFDLELKKLPDNVRAEVLESLQNKVDEFGFDYVLPEHYKNIIG